MAELRANPQPALPVQSVTSGPQAAFDRALLLVLAQMFFEIGTMLNDHEGRITANEATLADHESRITALEP